VQASPHTSVAPAQGPVGIARARWLAGALAVGLGLRLAFGLGYWVGKPLTHDEQEYLLLASNLAAGRGFVYGDEDDPSRERYGRAPAYPFFLAPLIGGARDFTDVPGAVTIAQSLLGVAGIWLIALLAGRAAGPTAGLLAAWLAAVYPPLVWISAYALSEALFSPLALASAWLLGRAVDDTGAARDRSGDRRAVLLAGVVAGLAALTRPVMLLFLLVAGLWLLRRRRLAVAALLAAGALLVIGPWTVRNALQHGRFVLVASEGGITFWTGNHPLARGEGDLAANPQIKRANLEFRARHPGLTPEELEPLYYREALAAIAERPLWWAGLIVRKFFYTCVPIGPSYTLHSPLYLGATWIAYGTVLPVALLGALRLRRVRQAPRALALLAGSMVLAGLIFLPQERFRIPVIDPALIVCAAAWIALRRPGEGGDGPSGPAGTRRGK
jgi:4-amino-4-deoxy-L-arabinose transferase-like glycosyltransferase